MLWAAVAKFCSISRMKVSAAFSRASCLRLGRICGISPRSRSPQNALAPDADETSPSQQENFPVTDVFNYVEVADGRVWMRPEGVVCFAGDLSEQEQKVVWATHCAPAADLFSRNAPATAWKSKPTWYIVANNYRTVQPDLQRFLAKRVGATTHAVDSSHVPMLSHPDSVIDVVRAAAKAVQRSSATA